MPIINSLLNTDYYKITQAQLALHQFPSVEVEYKFKCRNQANWKHEHLVRLREEIKHWCSLRFTDDELTYLKSLNVFKPSFLEFLRLYQPNINHITLQLINNELEIRVKGPWYSTIFFEVPVLAIVNEIYFQEHQSTELFNEGLKRLDAKLEINNQHPFKFADFGTRRRFSNKWHRDVVEQLKKHCPNFVGTSNVLWAKEFALEPIGTMAHEMFMVHQAVYPLHTFQKHALKNWLKEYEGQLGIALTDTVGIDAFLSDFATDLANAYSGVRQDSGSPFTIAEKIIQHYRKLRIDPKTKTLIFSDGLDFAKASKLWLAYKDSINVVMGVGTDLTNDLELTPLQIVMKPVRVNGQPVIKLSDSTGKEQCEDPKFAEYMKSLYRR